MQNGQVIFDFFFSQKQAENDSTEPIELFFAKNRVQKHQIVEIWEHFEDPPF